MTDKIVVFSACSTLDEARRHHRAEQALLGGAVPGGLFRSQTRTEEVPNDFVITLAVHPLVHGFAGLDSEAAVVSRPGFPVYPVRIENHAIHVEDEREPSVDRHTSEDFNSLSSQFM